ncbi:MAG: C4-type zinc ribbon domain-containing protein [Bacteroidales bacterium]
MSKASKTVKKSKPPKEEAVITENKIITTKTAPEESLEQVVKKKLINLYTLQRVDHQIDKIRAVRGELPLEVQDLEDEIAGLETRIEKMRQDIDELDQEIINKKNAIVDCNELIKKYETQQMNVRNNREYDSLTKEIEYQSLEVQLCEKKIKEYTQEIETKTEILNTAESNLAERKDDLNEKNKELEDIVSETQKEEEQLIKKSQEQEKSIEERLLVAYRRIRNNSQNGLAVVVVERDACGGCFNKIPPQRQLDIKLHKKIIVCEYCGRVLVDEDIADSVEI